MPLVQKSDSIAASAVNDNLLTGSLFERLPFPAMLEFAVNGDANGADMRMDIYSGMDVIIENSPLNVKAALPVYPDDFLLNDAADYGEQIKIRVRNTSAAGARTVYWAMMVTPL